MRILFILTLSLLTWPAFAYEPIEGHSIDSDTSVTDPVMDIMNLNEISPAAGLGNSIMPSRPTSKDDARSLYFDLQSVTGEGQY